jgi:hypothetical protein
MGTPTDAELAAEARRLPGGAVEQFKKKLQELGVLRHFSLTYDIARLGGIRAECSFAEPPRPCTFHTRNQLDR